MKIVRRRFTNSEYDTQKKSDTQKGSLYDKTTKIVSNFTFLCNYSVW